MWISDTGPERGTVKWIGHLYDTRDGEWTVGVDFVSYAYAHLLVPIT